MNLKQPYPSATTIFSLHIPKKNCISLGNNIKPFIRHECKCVMCMRTNLINFISIFADMYQTICSNTDFSSCNRSYLLSLLVLRVAIYACLSCHDVTARVPTVLGRTQAGLSWCALYVYKYIALGIDYVHIRQMSSTMLPMKSRLCLCSQFSCDTQHDCIFLFFVSRRCPVSCCLTFERQENISG